MDALITLLARISCSFLGVLVPIVLSSCSGATTTRISPPVWTNYRGNAFTINYLSNWDVATKDLYLGTRYPQLEMLRGTVFTRQGASTTFLQVVYAVRTSNTASAKDIMLKFLLGSPSHSAAASSLSTTTLAGENWYQGSIEKQVSQGDGPTVAVKEMVLGIDHATGGKSTEIYLIFYQDATSTYTQNTRDFFQRMLTSFHFVP